MKPNPTTPRSRMPPTMPATQRSRRRRGDALCGWVSVVMVFTTGYLSCHSKVRFFNREAEHHPTLEVLRDVAMQHPDAGIAHIDQDVDRLPRGHQHCVLPGQVVIPRSVAGEHEEALAVDVDRMLHGMVPVWLVDDSDLHPIPHLTHPHSSDQLPHVNLTSLSMTTDGSRPASPRHRTVRDK